MAKTICKAWKTGQVHTRGKATIEWTDRNGKPVYYCYGYVYPNGDTIPVCAECPDHYIKAMEDLEMELVKERQERKTKEVIGEPCQYCGEIITKLVFEMVYPISEQIEPYKTLVCKHCGSKI